MPKEVSVRFTTAVTYYDGRPNHLGDCQCTVANGQGLVVQARNRDIRFRLSDITSVAEGRHSGGKEVDVTIGGTGVLKFWFPNPMQAYWLHAVLRHATAGDMTDPVPDMPPGTKDRTIMWGNLGILFGLCFWPLGLLFAVLSFADAKKNIHPPLRAIVAILACVVGVFGCIAAVSGLGTSASY